MKTAMSTLLFVGTHGNHRRGEAMKSVLWVLVVLFVGCDSAGEPQSSKMDEAMMLLEKEEEWLKHEMEQIQWLQRKNQSMLDEMQQSGDWSKLDETVRREREIKARLAEWNRRADEHEYHLDQASEVIDKMKNEPGEETGNPTQ